MRKQVRPVGSTAFVQHMIAWKEQWSANLCKEKPAAFAWYEREGRSAREWILEVLIEMNQGHCSFCDAFPLESSSKLPIEHFKPKSQYPQEAYDWQNLYCACEYCQSAKGDTWDELLIRPDSNEYDFFDYFAFDLTTGALIPNEFASPENQQRALATINIYNLDSLDLRRYRLLELRKWRIANADLRDINEFAYRDLLELPK